jgi:hypothetical protein
MQADISDYSLHSCLILNLSLLILKEKHYKEETLSNDDKNAK